MIVKPKGSLRSVIRRYYGGNKNSYTDGDWSIANGGNDCWFEIYLNNEFFITCVDGVLGGSLSSLFSYGMSYDDALNYFNKCIKIILDEYPNTSYTKEKC